MALKITDNYQMKYESRWRTLMQQTASRLEKYVVVDSSAAGKIMFYDQIGKSEMEEHTTRLAATIMKEIETDRRAIMPRKFALVNGIDEWDKMNLNQLDVPVSKIQEQHRNAANRKMDAVMIEGFLGNNTVGSDTAMKTVAFDPKQIIAADYVRYGTAKKSSMTTEKLLEALAILMKSEAVNSDGADDTKVLVLSSKEITDMMNDPRVSSADYNTLKTLAAGEIDSFMGFKIIRYEGLPYDSGTQIRQCLAWVKSAAQFALWENPKTKVSVRDDMDEALQIRSKMACGACRIEEGGFVRIDCYCGADAAAPAYRAVGYSSSEGDDVGVDAMPAPMSAKTVTKKAAVKPAEAEAQAGVAAEAGLTLG